MLYLDYNEKQIHGTKNFPVAFYHVDSSHPRYEMPFHWHKEYEIVRILEGTFRFMSADGETVAGSGESLLSPAEPSMAECPKTVFTNALSLTWTCCFSTRT